MDNIKRQEVFAALAPDVTESFHKTVCDTLEGIILLEEKDQRAQERPRAVRPPWHSYRTLAFALLLALLVIFAPRKSRKLQWVTLAVGLVVVALFSWGQIELYFSKAMQCSAVGNKFIS